MKLSMIKWLSLIAIAAALVWGIADARNVGHGFGRAGGTGDNSGFSPDGSFIEGAGATFSPVAGSSASLVNPYGVWTMGQYRTDLIGHWCVDPMQPVHNGCSDQYELFLNGHRIATQEEFVGPAFGNHMFYSGFDQTMTLYGEWRELPNNGCYWDHTTCTGPESPADFPDIPAAPTWPRVSTATPPDGTSITAPFGTISNEYGVWSWGPAASGGGYRILLNGTYMWPDDTQPGNGTELQVNSNGLMFIHRPDGIWLVWLDYQRVGANAPTGQVIPLRIEMTPTAAPVSPACGDKIFRLPNVGAVGRVAGYLTIPMSDGSIFAGTVTIGANSGITLFNASLGLDGVVTLTTKQDPLYGLDNIAGISISASQNGTTVNGFYYWFDMNDCTSRP